MYLIFRGRCKRGSTIQPFGVTSMFSNSMMAILAKQLINFSFRLPDHISFDAAALLEPLSVAIHSVNRAAPTPGSTAVVIGVSHCFNEYL